MDQFKHEGSSFSRVNNHSILSNDWDSNLRTLRWPLEHMAMATMQATPDFFNKPSIFQ